MKKAAISLTVEDENQNLQELLNEHTEVEVELSDAELGQIKGAAGITFNPYTMGTPFHMDFQSLRQNALSGQ